MKRMVSPRCSVGEKSPAFPNAIFWCPALDNLLSGGPALLLYIFLSHSLYLLTACNGAVGISLGILREKLTGGIQRGASFEPFPSTLLLFISWLCLFLILDGGIRQAGDCARRASRLGYAIPRGCFLNPDGANYISLTMHTNNSHTALGFMMLEVLNTTIYSFLPHT